MAKRAPQVRDLIEQLGEAQTIADELNKLIPKGERRVNRDAIYQWKLKNEIPHYRRPYVAQLAVLKDKALPLELAIHAPSRASEQQAAQ